ncbi:hypothetical protein L0B52_03020 [Suttonella sp. R2A3]|uniref:hypothetical protein n=1 Tax=Suttonella sp. R2A3 TaxID=2908648 RepID=UPI001F3B6256|nr:hypothetical protein [Suttonella sp. R2A3]UJF25133.1 hypothetical protein L0B52_03020 [Suttonella sp. R2A3]
MTHKNTLSILAAALLYAQSATAADLAAGESYPSYYPDAGRIVVKDVMTRFFNVSDKGILSYGMEDAAKAAGHVCPAVTGAFLITQAGVDALAQSYREQPSTAEVSSYDPADDMLYRGGIKITMSGQADTGSAANAMANVMSYITGAKDASGFKGGPDFPFANRQNLLQHDPNLSFDGKTGIEAIFTSMTATYSKEDGSPATLAECQGTWHQCIERTSCDRSVKVTYHFKSPEIIGNNPDARWDEKIHHIINQRDVAINVEPVDNPAALCKSL